MNSQNLAEWIHDDIETIKTLNPEVIPTNLFYKEALGIYKWVVVFFFVVPLFLMCLAGFGELELEAYPIYFGIMAALFLLLMTPLFFIQPIQFYVIFKNQIASHLKTKDIVINMIHRFASIYLTTYLCVLGFGVLLIDIIIGFEQACGAAIILGTLIGNFIASMFTSFYVSSELSRVGLTTLFQAISGVREH